MSELFRAFQTNTGPGRPLLLWLLGGSLTLHIAVIACVIYVPALRDSLNIAAMISKTGYVDRAYSKTDIGEEVQMVMLSGGRFHYPEGYFSIDWQTQSPYATPAPTPFFTKITPPVRRPTPEPEITPLPSPSVSPELSAVPSPTLTPSPGNPAVADDAARKAQTEQELNKIAAENGVVRPSEDEINIRPLKDWLKRANDLKVKGDLDLSTEVEITIAADLTSDCRLGDAKVIQKSGDTRLVDVAKEMVSAIGDSRLLSFLRDPKKVKDPKELRCDELPLQLTIKLDQSEITARVESSADSPERAAEMARGYGGLLMVGQLVKRGKDEEMLYKSTKVTAEGKQIIVSFSMPRATAGEMLKRQLPAS